MSSPDPSALDLQAAPKADAQPCADPSDLPTQLERSDRARRAAEGQLEAVLHAVGAGTWMWDLVAGRIEADERLAAIMGRPRSALTQDYASFLACFHTHDVQSFEESVLSVLGTDARASRPLRVVWPDGETRYVRARAELTPGSEGGGGKLSLVCMDVTDRVRAADALLRRDEDLNLILQSITSILITLDEQGRVRLWNEAAEAAFHVSSALASGQELATLVRWNVETVRRAFGDCVTKRCVTRIEELAYEVAPDFRGLLGMTLTPMVRDDGCDCLILGRDITEQRKLDAHVAHSLKLESIGQLAAGIAHEINTPTQFVGDNVRFLRDSFRDLIPLMDAFMQLVQAPTAEGIIDPQLAEAGRKADLEYLRSEIPKSIEESLAGLERVAKIVGAMKEFSHPGSGEKVAVDLNRAIQSTTTVARNEWKYVAELELDLDPSLPEVPCLPDQMNQVILNIVVNAAHAIGAKYGEQAGRKGKIRISTRQSQEQAEIRISDDGSGIPENIRGRIFDPFFTTKGVGKGTGQGLAISRSVVVDKHQGSIHVESTVGEGTTFVIRLPLGTAALAAVQDGQGEA